MTRARTLADMISDGVIGTTELADDAITPVKLDETGNYTIAQLGVNGTVTADGLTVDHNTGGPYNVDKSLSSYSSTNGVYLNGNASGWLRLNNDGTGSTKIDLYGSSYAEANVIKMYSASNERLSIDANGDISFYDTSGNAKFVWDASQESLAVGAGSLNLSGVGTNSQNSIITLQGTNQFRGILELASQTGVSSSGSPAGEIRIFDAGNLVGKIAGLGTDLTNHDDGDLQFSTSSNGTLSEVLRLTSDRTAKISTSQNMGSLATFPSYSGEGAYLKGFVNGGGSGPYPRYLDLAAIGDSSWGGIMRFITNPDSSSTGQERMRISDDGYVGINYTAPSRRLYVASNDSSTGGNVVAVRNNNSTAGAFINFVAGGANAPSVGAKGNDIVFTDDGYSGNEHLRLTNSGNLLLRSTDTPGITGGVSPYLEFRAGQTNGQNVSLAKMRGYSPGAWGGDLVIETKPANGQVNDTTVEGMRVDQAGRVTKPKQPSFYAFRTGSNYSSSSSGYEKLVANGTRWNEGSHYSTSNNRFTAPIAGVYHFDANVNRYGVNDDFLLAIAIYVNGSVYAFGNRFHSRGTTDLVASMSITAKLSANDYVEVWSYSDDSGTGFSQGAQWNTFSGYLLG